MRKCWLIIALLLGGCGGRDALMSVPEDPQGRYHDQIAVARRSLEQNENWTDRAEWEVVKTEEGWQITAWRVEHPNAKGPDRYLPWGCSVIELDSRLVAVKYHRKG